MAFRPALEKDIPKILELLTQVAAVHRQGRPDLFREATTKYTAEQLSGMLDDDKRPIIVSTDEDDAVCGYAFCIFRQYLDDNILTPVKTLYIDDLCVDENLRGKHIGQALYEYVLDFARKNDCYNVTLNVWACNEAALKFYERCGLKPQKIGMETIL